MPKPLELILTEISQELPEALWARADFVTDSVIISNYQTLEFAIRRKTIDDNLYMETVRGVVPHLQRAIEWPRLAYQECSDRIQKAIEATGSAEKTHHEPFAGQRGAL